MPLWLAIEIEFLQQLVSSIFACNFFLILFLFHSGKYFTLPHLLFGVTDLPICASLLFCFVFRPLIVLINVNFN